MEIDVTITATCRAKILDTTLNSFFKNLLCGFNCKGIINIDVIGPDTVVDIIKILETYFKKLEINISHNPSFGEAFKWCWSMVERSWVFHLEDDWLLNRPVYLDHLKSILDSEPNLALLRLPQFLSGQFYMKNWNKFFPWNGLYYKCPEELKGGLGFCGHPSLIKSQFVENVRKYINPNLNPEKQFHAKSGPLMDEVLKWEYGVYGYPGMDAFITDLGRKWMIKNGYAKEGNKAYFMKWKKTA